MVRHSNNGRSRTADPFDAVRGDIAVLRKDLARVVSGGIGAAGDRASRVVSAARDRAGEMHERLAEVASKRPLTALAIAAVSGVVIAALIGRAGRR